MLLLLLLLLLFVVVVVFFVDPGDVSAFSLLLLLLQCVSNARLAVNVLPSLMSLVPCDIPLN